MNDYLSGMFELKGSGGLGFVPFAAGGLTRVSTPGQVDDGVSLQVQTDYVTKIAEQMGIPLIGVYEDAGISGDLFDTRMDLQRALADMRAKRFNVLIVHDLSRLTWNPEHLPRILREIELSGGRLYVHLMGQFVTPGDYTQEFFTGMQVQVDRYYRRHLRNEVIKAKRKAASQGNQVCRGMRPFGYEIVTSGHVIAGVHPKESEGKYILIPKEAEVVKKIFNLFTLEGYSLRGITKELNKQDVKPLRSEEWSVSTIHNMLENPNYKGVAQYGVHRSYKDESRLNQLSSATGKNYKAIRFNLLAPAVSVISFECPPIVSVEIWDAAQVRMKENHERFSGRNDRKYLLSGLYFCPDCGELLHAQGDAKSNTSTVPAYFSCRRSAPSRLRKGEEICSRTRYRMGISEQLVAQAIQGLVTRADLIAATANRYLAEEAAKQKNNTTADNNIGARERLEKQIKEIEQKRSALMSQDIPVDFLASSLRELGIQWQQFKDKLRMLPQATQEEVSHSKPAVLTLEQVRSHVSSMLVNAESILLNPILPIEDRHRVLRGIVERIIPQESPATETDANGKAIRNPHSPASPVSVTVEFRGGLKSFFGQGSGYGERVANIPIFCTVTTDGGITFSCETYPIRTQDCPAPALNLIEGGRDACSLS